VGLPFGFAGFGFVLGGKVGAHGWLSIVVQIF
jgi:hypothetical protein